MVTSAVGKLAGYGLLGGTIGLAAIKPKSKSGEHVQNKAGAAATLGLLATTPYLAKKAVAANPKLVEKVALKTGTFIEKAAKFVADKAPKVIAKMKSTTLGTRVIDGIKKAGKFLTKNAAKFLNKNPKLKNFVVKAGLKAVNALEKFAKAPAAKKGKIALVAAGVALLANAVVKTVTNYYKREGAIDQKYADMRA